MELRALANRAPLIPFLKAKPTSTWVAPDGSKARVQLSVYIDRRAVEHILDTVAGPDRWTWDILQAPTLFGKDWVTHGRLTIHLDDGRAVFRDGIGTNSAGDAEMGAKGSESDALKRAAASFGLGRALGALGNVWCDAYVKNGKAVTTNPGSGQDYGKTHPAVEQALEAWRGKLAKAAARDVQVDADHAPDIEDDTPAVEEDQAPAAEAADPPPVAAAPPAPRPGMAHRVITRHRDGSFTIVVAGDGSRDIADSITAQLSDYVTMKAPGVYTASPMAGPLLVGPMPGGAQPFGAYYDFTVQDEPADTPVGSPTQEDEAAADAAWAATAQANASEPITPTGGPVAVNPATGEVMDADAVWQETTEGDVDQRWAVLLAHFGGDEQAAWDFAREKGNAKGKGGLAWGSIWRAIAVAAGKQAANQRAA